MAIRNSLKLLLDNFSNIWKILLYKSVVFLIGAGLIAGLVLPNVITILSRVSDTGLFTNLEKIINDFFTRGVDLSANLEAFTVSLENSSLVLSDNARRLLISYIYIILIIIVISFMSGMSELAVSDILNADMSANAKFNFSSSFIVTFLSNIRYQLSKLAVQLPAKIIAAFVIWEIFSFMLGIIGIFSLFFAFAAYILVASLLQAFFLLQLPEITVKQTKAFKALKKGFKMVKPQFKTVFSSLIFINISVFFVNIVLAFFTCGAGLLISLPVSSLFMVIYKLVTYYETNGLRYYIDKNNIVVPKNNKDIE